MAGEGSSRVASRRAVVLPTLGQAAALLALIAVVAGGVIALTSMLHYLSSLRDH